MDERLEQASWWPARNGLQIIIGKFLRNNRFCSAEDNEYRPLVLETLRPHLSRAGVFKFADLLFVRIKKVA